MSAIHSFGHDQAPVPCSFRQAAGWLNMLGELFSSSAILTPSFRASLEILSWQTAPGSVSWHSLAVFVSAPRQTLRARNRRAAALIGRWLAEEDGYDQEVWPALEQELASARARFRE